MKSTSLSTKLIMILLLFAVIGYFAVQGYNYLVSPETTTLVYRYRSEQSIAVRGCVVRKEQVVDCGETLIELKHAEGERVGQGDTIAAVYRSAEALSATQELESLRAQKEQLEYAKSASSDAATALRLDTDIREQIVSVRAAYESGAYSSLDTLIPQLKTTVLKREYAYNGSDDLTARLDELSAQISALSSAASGGTTRITAYGAYSYLDQVHSGGGFLPYVGTVVNAPFGKIRRDAFFGEPSIDSQKRVTTLLGYEFQHDFGGVTFSQNARYGQMRGSQLGPYGYGYAGSDAPFGNRFEPLAPDYRLYRIGFQENTKVNTFTIDNRLEGKFDTGPLQHSWMVGLDYKYFEIDHVQASGGATTISVTNPVYGAPQGASAVYLDQKLKHHQVGIYLQDQIRFGGGWLATFNGRYDYAEKKSVSPATLAFSPSYDDREGAFSGRAGLAYEFANGMTPYASVASFFNPVFDGTSPGTPGVFLPFKPEKGWQVEAGVKYKPTFADALFTASVFHIVKDNVLVPAPTFFNAFAQQQLGQVTSSGVEFEAKANLTENLKVLAALTAFNLEISKHTNTALVDRTPFIVPEITASGWADYTFNEGALKGLSLGAGVRYVGKSWADNANTLKVPGATLVDAAIRYKLGNWGLAVNVPNLFDKAYVKSCQDFSSCSYGDARTVTVSANYRW